MTHKYYLIICIFLLTYLNSEAQNEPVVSFSKGIYRLSDILESVEIQTGYKFAYSPNMINLKREFTLGDKTLPLTQFLEKLFYQTGIGWQVNGVIITLYKDRAKTFTISGYITEKGSSERLIGVYITTMPSRAGAVSNAYGYYAITLPVDTYSFTFLYTGFKQMKKTIILDKDIEWNVEMENDAQYEEVVVTARSTSNNNFEVGLKSIEQMPSLLGEKDVVRLLMLNPGVQKGNEGANYLYVRGGSSDQNLILIDDAVLYSVQHFLGISSLFSGSELRKVEMIKGGFSSKYGGRLSSVVDMRMKDGNREKLAGEASVGVISTRLSLEAPIVKNKSSFFISGRVSYIDKASELVAKTSEQVLNYRYYDVHAKVSTDLGLKNRLYVSFYSGEDQYGTLDQSSNTSESADEIRWGNRAASIRLISKISPKWFVSTTATLSNYTNQFSISDITVDDFTNTQLISTVNSSILDLGLKQDWEYTMGPNQTYRFGIGTIRHFFNPSAGITVNNRLNQTQQNSLNEAEFYSWENFVYAETDLKLWKKVNATFGLRCSQFITEGSKYLRAEPRVNIDYELPKKWHLIGTYSIMNQYVHQISNISLGLPIDYWMPVTTQIKPQRSYLSTLGFSKSNIGFKGISIGVDGYYKIIENAVWMREGSSFFSIVPSGFGQLSSTFVPVDWNKMITQGQTESYGMEVMVKHESKRMQVWVSYTLSKTMMQFDAINQGKEFRFTYDRTHDFGLFIVYRPVEKFSISTSWVYGTGNAITLPTGTYTAKQYEGIPGGISIALPVYDYEQKNAYRMRDYHRLDLSFQYTHRVSDKIKGRLDVSVFNLYNRANPFFYTIENENQDGTGKTLVKQTSLFPIIPSVSYAITF